MKILPKIGTDIIKFGVTEDEAFKILGKTDKTYITDGENKRVQFYSRKIELSFEPENDNRLGWIEVHDPEAELYECNPIGMVQNEVLDIITSELGEEPKIEDYDSFVSATYDNNWVECIFSFGCLTNINLGVAYDEFDNPQWPNP